MQRNSLRLQSALQEARRLLTPWFIATPRPWSRCRSRFCEEFMRKPTTLSDTKDSEVRSVDMLTSLPNFTVTEPVDSKTRNTSRNQNTIPCTTCHHALRP